MKYKVYCSLNIKEYIEVEAENEDEAILEARLISIGKRYLEEVECEVVSKDE